MNKIVSAVAALIAAFLLLLPPALGMLTERRVRERVAAIDAGGVLSARLKSFERGWFGSDARIELGLTPGEPARLGPFAATASSLEQRVTIAVHFAHGPVAIQKGVYLGWSTMVARLDPATPGLAEIEQQLGVPYLFEFRGRTGFGGNVSFDADAPPIDAPAGVARFKFTGATIDGSYSGKRLTANARVDAFEFASTGGSLTLRNLRAGATTEIPSLYLGPGTAELSIESVAAVDALRGSTPVLEADHVKLTSTTTRNAAGTLLDMQATYGLDRLHVADNEVTSATIGVAFHNVDIATLERYTRAVRGVGAETLTDEPRAEFARDIGRALAAKPSVEIEPLRFTLDGEPFEGHLELTTDGKLPAGSPLDSSTLTALVNGDAEFRLSKPLARRIVALATEIQLGRDPRIPPEQVNYMAEAEAGLMLVGLVSQGWLIEDGEVYRGAVRYADGALALNGHPLPFGVR